jgi:hypothetical protein
MVHEHVAHHTGGSREEMRAIPPFQVAARQKPDEGFLHQRRRLHGMAFAFARQVAARNPV